MRWIKCGYEMPPTMEPVLVACVVEYTRKRIMRAYYCAHKSYRITDDLMDPDWTYYDEEEDEFYQPEGWYEFNEYEETHWQIDGNVTHWMPLPKFPGATND